MDYDAIIIGGGLAGCSTALQLARRGHSVVLFEKGTYPRQKLCGEFLSPEVRASFRHLGLTDQIQAEGATAIQQARLTAANGTETTHALPEPAVGLSRYALDALLYRTACEAGVEGHPGTRVTDVQGSLEDGFAVTAEGTPVTGRIVIGAHGRRGALDRTLDRPFLNEQSPYVAFKAHYAGPAAEALSGTIELHSAPGGYCGLSPVEAGRINVCWIGRVDALTSAGGTPTAMLTQHLRQNAALDERLHGLERVSEGFEAVSQVPLMPKERFVDDVCMVGDAAGMIAPLCGDGMGMALQTADLAAPLLDRFLRERDASPFRHDYRAAWRDAFGQRMRLGRWAHAAAFRPRAAQALIRACRWMPPFARWLIRSTRGL